MIKVNNLHKTFSGFEVIKDASFSIKDGEIVSIIGRSGCGKTTLLKIMMGLLKADAGTVEVSAESIGYVPQSLGLMPWRSVAENIRFPMELSGNIDTVLMSRIISLMGLSSFIRYYPHQLSGGMKQRVAIGRALVTNPSILFLDEPFRSLDEITRELLVEEFGKTWKTLGKTVILVTHSIREAVNLSDKIIVMSKTPSKVLFEGKSTEENIKHILLSDRNI
jgi:NitT/TauT family transport system ATP-binding protein